MTPAPKVHRRARATKTCLCCCHTVNRGYFGQKRGYFGHPIFDYCMRLHTLWQVNLWLGIYKDVPQVPFYKDSRCLTCLKIPKFITMLRQQPFQSMTSLICLFYMCLLLRMPIIENVLLRMRTLGVRLLCLTCFWMLKSLLRIFLYPELISSYMLLSWECL